jgi:ribosomal protein S12 methylthiotransferase accessory factor
MAWLRARQVVHYSSNGLASGNTLVEATLHALYEILERHVLAGLLDGARFDFSRASVFAPGDAPADSVRDLDERIAAAGIRLVLLRAKTRLALHSFMAVILDRDPLASVTAVNLGYGAHLSPIVAATRAITEAAQARLTFIHGSREDLRKDQYQRSAAQARVVAVMGKLEPNARWDELTDWSTDELETDLQAVLATMRGNGLVRAYCVDMSLPEMPFAVAKVWAPETRDMT